MSVKRFIQICLILVLVFASLGATTSNAQASSSCGSTYVVQRGDWLSRIARNCGVTLSELYAANQWARYSPYIYPGQMLTIPGGYDDGYDAGGPGGYCGPGTDLYGNYWLVCRGDTLGRIAQYYGVNWRYLQDVNSIPNANRIYPGQVIRL